MDQLIQTLIIGLANGLQYALIALGYTLVYGIIELINFAHGDLFMLSSMIALSLLTTLLFSGTLVIAPFGFQLIHAQILPANLVDNGGVGVLVVAILITLAITMVLTAVLNFLIERIAYRPLRNAPKLAPLISAIGMSFVLQNIGLLWFGPNNSGLYKDVIPNTSILPALGIHSAIVLTYKHVFVAAVTIPLLLALTYFVSRTKQGKAMRATAQDPDTAGLMGIDVNRTIALTFVIGGALAGAGGVVQMLFNNTTQYTLGFRFGLNSFTSAVLGGIGNLQGAVLGAIVLGFINAFSDRYISANWTDAIVFAVLITILVFRPTGLLGQQLADRA